MELDLQHATAHLVAGNELRAEVCVVGGGIAGLVLTQRLAERGVDVLLLEAGGRSAGEDPGNLGDPCGLGGTSAIWGGQLLPPAQLRGWPITVEEITPYVAQVERVLGVDSLPYEAAPFFRQLHAIRPAWTEVPGPFQARVSKFAPFRKRNLAASLGRAVLAHPSVRVLLRANAVALDLAEAGNRIRAVRVRLASGQTIQVAAQQVVLAAGTVETCRLLLTSGSVPSGGAGDRFDQVGKGLHDHLTLRAAVFHGSARAEASRQLRPWIVGSWRGTVHSFKLETQAGAVASGTLPAGMAHLTLEEPPGTGVAALREGLQRWQMGGWLRGAPLGPLLRGMRAAASLSWEAHRNGRRWVSPKATLALQLNVAQQIDPGSRLVLGTERDRFGQLKATWDRRVCAADLRGLQAMAAAAHQVLEGAGFTRAKGVAWSEALLDPAGAFPACESARHVMGGARMGMDRSQSVVDPALRVHGIENLSLASAAVFPDGQAQLPTLTLMALSLRLADRLAAEMARERSAAATLGRDGSV